MKDQLSNQTLLLLLKEKQKHVWRSVTVTLVAAVVFVTTYFLVLPALSLSTDSRVLDCTVSVHSHTESCFDEDGNIICGWADYVLHTHNSACYDQGELICTLTERTGETHSHSDSCYVNASGVTGTTLSCGLTELHEHVHTDACFRTVTTQTAEEDGVPMAVLEDDEEDAGWYIDENAVLHITAAGAMADYGDAYGNATNLPWDDRCADIAGVVVEEGVTSIGNHAFHGMTSLTSVSLPSTLTSIGDYAFYGCTALEEISLPDTVSSIGKFAFKECSALYRVELPKGGKLSALADSTFANCSSLVDIELPEGLTTIGAYCFQNCTSLQELSFPASLTTLKNYAYDGCSSLKTLELPDTITSVGDFAFQNCTSLQSVQWNNTVTSIPRYCFASCSSLTEISIPEGVTEIDSNAFYECRSLKAVTLPSTLTRIGVYTFYRCDKLISIEIPNSVTTIGSGAFVYCYGLESVTLPEGLKKLETDLFKSCYALKNVNIPDTVETISQQSFYQCWNLQSVELPAALREMYSSSFLNCHTLNTITLNSNITSSGTSASPLASLRRAILNASEMTSLPAKLFDGASLLEEITIGAGVDTISSSVLSELAAIAGDKGYLSFLGENTFAVTGEDVTVGHITLSAGRYYVSSDNVLYRLKDDGTAELLRCPQDLELSDYSSLLHTVTDDQGRVYTVTEIAAYAFEDNLYLQTITLPSNITSVSSYAYYNTPLWDELRDRMPASATTEPVTLTKSEEGNNYKLQVSLDIKDEDLLDAEINQTYTGKTATIGISLDDTSHGVSDTLRVYFKCEEDCGIYDKDNNTLFGYTIGQKQSFTSNSLTVNGVFCMADEPNLYYLELSGIDVGDTMHLLLNATYPNYTAGGTLLVWPDNSQGTEEPEEALYASWITEPDDFDIQVSPNNTLKAWGDGNAESDPYVAGFSYTIDLQRDSESKDDSYGKNPMEQALMQATLKLPEGTYLSPKVREAIENGDYRCQVYYGATNEEFTFYVKVDGEWLRFAYMQIKDAYNQIDQPALSVDAEGNPVVSWRRHNPNQSAEISAQTIPLSFGDQIVQLDVDTLSEMLSESGETSLKLSFPLEVTADESFRFGTTAFDSDETTMDLTLAETDYRMTKTEKQTSYSQYSRFYYLNETGSLQTTISLINNSIFPLSEVAPIVDELPDYYYIAPTDIEKMLADEYGDDLTITVRDMRISKASTERVMTTDGTYTLTQIAVTGVDTEHDGMAYTDDCDEEIVQLSIRKAEDLTTILLTVTDEAGESKTYEIGTNKEYRSLQAAFAALKFVNYQSTIYTCTWEIPDGVVCGAYTRKYIIYSNPKPTLNYLTTDINTRTNSDAYYLERYTNTARTSVAGEELTASVDGGIRWYMTLYKSVRSGNANVTDSTILTAGDILAYTSRVGPLTVANTAFPLVDHMSGGQTLLVPVEGNEALAGLGLATIELDTTKVTGSSTGTGTYYKLDKPGTYRQVTTLSGTIADTIVISEAEDGLDTLIYWYFKTTSNTNSKSVTYFAYVDPKYVEDDGSETYPLRNEVWAGDHQSHRLYDDTFFKGSKIGISKYIVTNAEEEITAEHDYTADLTVKDSIVEAGNTVVYRMAIRAIGDEDDFHMWINGTSIRDALPSSIRNYWSKDNISITYVDGEGNPTQVVNGDSWYVTEEKASTAGVTNQYIRWNDDFFINVYGTTYIYVTLTYPENGSDAWSELLNQFGTKELTNTFYVYDLQDSVTHLLQVDNVVRVQKGVYATGIYRSNGPYNEAIYDRYFDEDSTLYYQNKTSFTTCVIYYITIYNGGLSRVYFSGIQDILPEGFSYSGLASVSSITAVDTEDGSTRSISWINKYLSSVKTNTYYSNGHRVVDLYWTSGQYDSTRQASYLNPGQGVRIGIVATVGEYYQTDDAALNQMTVQFVNANGGDFVVDDSLSFTLQSSMGLLPNDGDCELSSRAEMESIGINTEKLAGDTFLTSSVTLHRGKIKPGIQKTCDVTQANTTDTLSWTIELTNQGEDVLEKYTVTDVMMSPYTYTGDVTMQISTTTNMGGSESDRVTKTITLFNASQLPAVGAGKVEINTIPFGFIDVRVDQNESGEYVLTIYFKSAGAAIPAGGRAVIKLSTVNLTGQNSNQDYINRAYLTPNKQSFSRYSVFQGNYTEFDVYSDSYGAIPSVVSEARVPVSFGYATVSDISITAFNTEGQSEADCDDSPNYVVAEDGSSTPLRYTLTVNNSGGISESKAMSLFVLVNNLPETDDHVTFYEKYDRYSEFDVRFAEIDDLNPQVEIVVDGVSTILSSDRYELLFSARTDLDYEVGDNSQIWTGETLTSADGWYTLEECKALGNWDEMRTVRLVIKDPDCAEQILPSEAVINFSYNALIDTENPGYAKTAWNSFGYLYQVDAIQLRSSSDDVGVKTVSMPGLQKSLVDYDGTDLRTAEDVSFTFLIYKGASQKLDASLAADELLDALQEKGLSATLARVTVPAGASESEELWLDLLYVYAYNAERGAWEASDQLWLWEQGAQYTVQELTAASNEDYNFLAFGDSSHNEYSFTYDRTVVELMSVQNQHKSWSLLVHKTSDLDGAALSDAVFGLYTTDPARASKGNTLNLNGEIVSAEATLEVEGVTWYLRELKASDTQGELLWSGLTDEAYYLLEVQAPNGFAIGVENGWVIRSEMDVTQERSIVNYMAYALPDSGGSGSRLLVDIGASILLIGLAGFGLILFARRRKVVHS